MVNWSLIRRCGLRYSLGYGSVTVAIVVAAATTVRSLALLFSPVLIGVLLVVYSLNGSGDVRTGAAVVANEDPTGVTGTTVDPADENQTPTTLESDLKFFFYAIGLIVFGILGMAFIVITGQLSSFYTF
ncbi:hypothetical protein [Halomicrococcus sp. SG-WS-1]|uniref:hypothetical protein n=1 Tax=Halomicrococcus sp. SG-WS-1 TaxID=3439057 RepID=UPI003F78EB42